MFLYDAEAPRDGEEFLLLLVLTRQVGEEDYLRLVRHRWIFALFRLPVDSLSSAVFLYSERGTYYVYRSASMITGGR